MATANHNSDVDLNDVDSNARLHSSDSSIGKDSDQVSPTSIWLEGDVLACACPECGSPMSVRHWLMMADCWRCGCSIELTEQQQREVRRFLQEKKGLTRPPSPPVEQPTAPPTSDKPVAPQPSLSKSPAQTAPAKRRVPPMVSVPPKENLSRKTVVKRLFRVRPLKDLPAWLVSLVFHLVLMLLLGLWISPPLQEARSITLSTRVGEEDEPGGIDDSTWEGPEFEAPGVDTLDVVPESTEPLGQRDPSVAGSVAIEIPHTVDFLSATPAASNFLASPVAVGKMFAGRDLSVRGALLRKEGGSSATEAAVARGLAFLARVQNRDGSWNLHTFPRGLGGEIITGEGSTRCDMAATALSLLPFLGAGQTHMKGEYSDGVSRGLQWLIEHQTSDGGLQGDGGSSARMYAHGQATIVLCEAYRMTQDQQLREPARRAIAFIVHAQHKEGGWRYTPGQAGDTSVFGWQIMALQSGKVAQLYPSSQTFTLAKHYLDLAKVDSQGSRYGYTPGSSFSHVMTAEALLCREYLGWPKDHPALRRGAKLLVTKYLPDVKKPNMYYWYYATQTLHHLGGQNWYQWNSKMRRILVDTQETTGAAAGSWAPRGAHASSGGRIYMTALAICTLEVYYRHLSIYKPSLVDSLAKIAAEE